MDDIVKKVGRAADVVVGLCGVIVAVWLVQQALTIGMYFYQPALYGSSLTEEPSGWLLTTEAGHATLEALAAIGALIVFLLKSALDAAFSFVKTCVWLFFQWLKRKFLEQFFPKFLVKAIRRQSIPVEIDK